MCKKYANETVEFDKNELVSVAEFGEPIYPCLKQIDSVCNAPDSELWHILIQADNYHALQLLDYLYAEKVDCIYIDPPYNTGARDWKYNNDYVDSADTYRHSKWLSMMKKRLELAKRLLNPKDSVLICTIDEKEYLHLGCLLEEIFPEARIQMVSSVINPKGNRRDNEFSRCEEYIYFVYFGNACIVSNGTDMLREQNLGDEEFISERKKKILPVLNEFHDWLIKIQPTVIPMLKFGNAINYALNSWNHILNYIECPEIYVDNSIVERSIKPFVLGRKNWLFAGSEDGARSRCLLFSLIECAKMHNINPEDYLRCIFEQATNTDSWIEDDWKKLLPWNVKITSFIPQGAWISSKTEEK